MKSMEISEIERIKLMDKKDEIRQLSAEIIECLNTEPDIILIKKNMNAILNLLSTIASYGKSSHNINIVTNSASYLFVKMNRANRKNQWYLASLFIEPWVNMVNSIEFNFWKKGINIKLPDFESIFKIQLPE